MPLDDLAAPSSRNNRCFWINRNELARIHIFVGLRFFIIIDDAEHVFLFEQEHFELAGDREFIASILREQNCISDTELAFVDTSILFPPLS